VSTRIPSSSTSTVAWPIQVNRAARPPSPFGAEPAMEDMLGEGALHMESTPLVRRMANDWRFS
jgi:hypothetical protein